MLPLSIRQRARLAVLLSFGFYALALGICALLAFLVYLQFAVSHVFLKGIIACVAGIAVILKGIFPRTEKFQPPGPRISAEEHPDLFKLIDRVADATAQKPPAEVYLVLDVNAWVTEIGDWSEGKSKRLMGVGLPLLQTLTIAELTSVLSHEFGHYHAGDTKLGPFIYKTRAAIIRTLQGLAQHKSVLSGVFEWYGVTYVRFTQSVSRQQELVADALAAQIAGAATAASALRKIARAAAAYRAYMASEVQAVIQARYLPPIAEGFTAFMESERIRPQLDQYLDAELDGGTSDPFDSHPSLRERLAAFDAIRDTTPTLVTPAEIADRPAISLLSDVLASEAAVVASLIADPAHTLTPLSWDSVPATVYPPAWTATVLPIRDKLVTLKPADVARLAQSTSAKPDAIADYFELKFEGNAPAEQKAAIANGLLCTAVALSLFRQSQRAGSPVALRAPVGENVSFQFGADSIWPFDVVRDLSTGALAESEWMRLCAAAGVDVLDPADAVTATA
jgi:heat shock protein HtpX